MDTWVYIKDGREIDRRVCKEFRDADIYENAMRAHRGLKWVDSWCTIENARLLNYQLDTSHQSD